MIRHIHNAVVHQSTARTAVRQPATAAAETNPFRSVLEATGAAPATTTDNTAPLGTAPQITATVTKAADQGPAKPTVTLSPPVFQQGVTTANPDGSTSHLNPMEFAAPLTAKELAAKLGGVVDEGIIPGFSSTQLSIRVPGSPNLVNAGIAAQLFATYGDKPGSQAWQIINRDIGRDPMST